MKQCALIIGNNAYADAPLKNAVNDAVAIAAKLTDLGFKCLGSTDATYREMDRNLSEFRKQLSAHEVGLFFFAGHGMQIEGVNYLGAVDTNFETELDAKHSSLCLNKVIETMEQAGNRTSIFMLDACRNNPYERRWRGAGPRGLAPVYAPKGMIIGYATSPGQVASDGDGSNGAYTHALLSHIGQQDLNIEGFFKRVRNTLSSSTNGRQISWEHTSLMGDYFFNDSRALAEAVTAYSEEAFADGDFRPHGPVGDIIAGLKSHDWYKQNPALAEATPAKLANVGKDDCFVLGRNIYQAACGDSKAARFFMSSLAASLSGFTEPVRFHLLNGMLYEVYFDSRGLKRKRAKADQLDEIFALEDVDAYSTSFEFIRKALLPYLSELFYTPGSKTEVCVDLVVGKSGDVPVLTKVCFEGQNVLYNVTGDGYFDVTRDFLGPVETRATLRAKLSAALATPTFRLKISYVGSPLLEDKIQAPHNFNLQRIAPK